MDGGKGIYRVVTNRNQNYGDVIRNLESPLDAYYMMCIIGQEWFGSISKG